jgi:osmoprotectant transport system substrate-binding protein
VRRSAFRPVAVLLAVVGLVACGSGGTEPPGPAPPPDTVRIASYDFAENQVLAEVYAEAARRAGVAVSVQHGIGTREIVAPALQQGAVDVVVDYLGTALAFARPGAPRRDRTTEEMHAALELTLGARGVSALEPAAAEDQNGFAVTTDFAAEHGVGRLSELAPLAGELTFGGPPECPDRPFCLPGLREVYGLEFGTVLSMPSRAATVEALRSGQIDVGLLETTDARLGIAPVMLLIDDKSLQPHENIVPLVRTATLERQGNRLAAALDAVSARLSTADLSRLNRSVEVDGLSPADAAALWWAG